jgi:hypothetical protein
MKYNKKLIFVAGETPNVSPNTNPTSMAEKNPFSPLDPRFNEPFQYAPLGPEELVRLFSFVHSSIMSVSSQADMAANTGSLQRQPFFACDDGTAISQWVSSTSLPVQNEIIQPPQQKPAMTYPGDRTGTPSTLKSPLTVEKGLSHNNTLLIPLERDESSGYAETGSSGRESGETSQPTRRGAFKSEHSRQETAQTRKLTACLRCRNQRIRVRSYYFNL